MADNDDVENQLMVLGNFGPVSDVFKDSPVDATRFTSGIGQAWPTLTIKGKTWGVRARGVDIPFEEPNPRGGGNVPVRDIDVVMVDAGNRISKVYYANPFVDGQRPPPDCWSADGVTPDPGAANKQADTCRGCPHNVMGSRINQATGARGKACSDNKRIAVVWVEDMSSDLGPIMLRLPPGSFQNYSAFVRHMALKHYAPYTFVTRLSFDPKAAHPKIVFRAVRTLDNQEAAIVKEIQKNPILGEMLNDKALGAFLDPEAADDEIIGELPKTQTIAADSLWAKQQPVPAPKPEPKPEPKLTPAQQEIADLKAQLAAAEAKAVEPEPEPIKEVKTPEQLEIEQLKARVAEMEAAKKATRKPRSQPVSPPVTPDAKVTATGNGTDPAEEAAKRPSLVGNKLSDRLNKLVGPK